MATSINNLLTKGFRGKLGGLVFRNCNGRSIISQSPRKSSKRPTENQAKHMKRFKYAVKYSQAVNDEAV